MKRHLIKYIEHESRPEESHILHLTFVFTTGHLKDRVHIEVDINQAAQVKEKLLLYKKLWDSMIKKKTPVNFGNEHVPLIKEADLGCQHACSPSDWYQGGKCDRMGCYDTNN